ncbi:MAG: FecR domain-containing protein [Candidatus Omnitrophica bacterium]|nr:FecR domain-containing protein [Candidatus Omnitrophota bacterium]
MKRSGLILICVLVLLFPVSVFAQEARIIDIRGRVTVKLKDKADWERARIDMLLNREAQVKTDGKSSCTLAFDGELKNIMTVKENSHIKIENLAPANIFLPEGRVFTLIRNLSKSEEFSVRTPTAVAGARGTGWITDFHAMLTSVLCHDNRVFVDGLDAAGNVTEEQDLSNGWGLKVGEGGRFSDVFILSDDDRRLWDRFEDNVLELTGEESEDWEAGNMGELRREQRQDFSDIKEEARRSEAEEAREENRGGGTVGGGHSITIGH